MLQSLRSKMTGALVVSVFMFFGINLVQGQAASASWTLTSSPGNASASGAVTASAVTKGSSFGTMSFGANGVAATIDFTWWAMDDNGYFEYKVAPTSSTFVFQAINFEHSSNGAMTGEVYYSLDNFGTRTSLGGFSPGGTFTLSGLSIAVPVGTTLSVRVYGWSAGFFNSGTLRNRNMIISGTNCTLPVFTTQPSAATACIGSPLTLTAAASNATSFQWKKNGVNINGATSAVYTKAVADINDAGTYSVDAIGCTTITSNSVVVSAGYAPTNAAVTATANTICLGGSSNLSASATVPSGSATGSNGSNFNIPDNNANGITSQITVPATCATANNIANVHVDITHGSNSQLDIYLVAPNGSQIALAEDKGGSGNNYNATFQTGGSALPTGNSSVSGNFSPQQAFSNLSGAGAGTWSLVVKDDTQYGTGTLTGWSITLSNATCGNVTYSWSPATGLSNAGSATPVATPSETTTYTVTIANATGCTATAATTITVTPSSVGGSVSGGTTVCAGSNSGSLTLGGHVGNILHWESSPSLDFSNPTSILNTTATLNYSNLDSTTYYRAVVSNGCASAFSSAAGIIVGAPAVGGTVSGDATVCGIANNGMLSLAGYSGTITGWESSADGFATAGTPIANATAALEYLNLTETTSFRAVISGVCGNVYSSVATVTVGSSTEWNGTAWSNGVPNESSAVTFSGDYTSSGNLSACSVVVTNNAAVVLATGNDITIGGALDVQSGSFTLENNANLLQLSDLPNSGNIVVKRDSSPLMRLDYTLWSSPVSGQNLQAFSPVTTANRFYVYNTDTNLFNTVTPEATNFDNGIGYLIRMPNNHPTTPTVWHSQFSGVPHNGTVNVPLANVAAGQRFNLVGNPYPSPIDLNEFIAQNAGNITGTLYFWRKTNNENSPSYCSWSTAGFVDNGELQVVDPNDMLQTGQGFFVEATASGTSVAFNNTQRVGNNAGQFFRSAQDIERNRIWLNATGAGGEYSQTLVSYMTGATEGIDAGIDGTYKNDGPIALTSAIEGGDYVIQGRSLPFVASDVVPLNFKATTAGSYEISIDHMDGLFLGEQNVYLRDNLTGMLHDLKSSAYAFTADAGLATGRFELVFENALAVEHPSIDANSVVVYRDNGKLVVNAGSMTIDNIKVYDMRGRLVTEKNGINASVAALETIQNQVLILKITSDDNRTVTRKAIN
jgi:subtilisin-like proprotein convertase family protein